MKFLICVFVQVFETPRQYSLIDNELAIMYIVVKPEQGLVLAEPQADVAQVYGCVLLICHLACLGGDAAHEEL